MSRNSSLDTDGYIKLLAWSCSYLCKPRQLVNNDGNDNSNNYKCMFIEHILTQRQLVSLITNIKLLLSSWTVSPLVYFLPQLCALDWILSAAPLDAVRPCHWVRSQVVPAPTLVYSQYIEALGFKSDKWPFPAGTWHRPSLVAKGSCLMWGAGAGIPPTPGMNTQRP